MLASNITLVVMSAFLLIFLAFNWYLVSVILTKSRQHVSQLELQHARSLLVVQEIAESAIEHVKAASLTEREQVRAAREVNNVQINQLRDIIKKQADMISVQDTKPEKVKLSDGTEINPDDYEWNVSP